MTDKYKVCTLLQAQHQKTLRYKVGSSYLWNMTKLTLAKLESCRNNQGLKE